MKLRTILVAVLALATMALSSAAGMGQVNPAAAADNLTQKMYWTDAIADRIQRANLDGSGVDSEGATSEKSTRIEITSILDKDSNASSPSPSPPTPRSPRPPTPTPGPTTLPPTPVAGPTSIPTPEVVAYQTPTTLPEPKREPVPETERTPIRLESSPLPGKTSQSIPPGSNKGDVFTYKDGDRTVRVVLQNDLVVQKTAANTPDDIVIVKGAGDSIVRRQDKHGQDARPVFRPESGSGMMTLPGGVLLVLNAEWGQSEKERFFLDNNIAPDRISELGYLTNGFLIETDPGFNGIGSGQCAGRPARSRSIQPQLVERCGSEVVASSDESTHAPFGEQARTL